MFDLTPYTGMDIVLLSFCLSVKYQNQHARSPVMKLLLYASLENERIRLEECVRGLAQNPDFDAIVSIDELAKRLRQPINTYALAIILIASREELDNILITSKRFSGLKTIVIIPDRNPTTITAALKLYPRYMTYLESNFEDVSLVANHMLEKLQMSKESQMHGDEYQI